MHARAFFGRKDRVSGLQQGVELVLVLRDHVDQRPAQPRPVVERHGPKGRAADLAGVADDAAEIDACGRADGQQLARDGAVDGLTVAVGPCSRSAGQSESVNANVSCPRDVPLPAPSSGHKVYVATEAPRGIVSFTGEMLRNTGSDGARLASTTLSSSTALLFAGSGSRLGADIAVVAAYGRILPQVLLDRPRFGFINVHASLLPRWRGAAPIHRAILAGDLAFVWADQLFDSAALPAAAMERARAVFTQLRVEVMAGQYLDLRLAGGASPDLADALALTFAAPVAKREKPHPGLVPGAARKDYDPYA